MSRAPEVLIVGAGPTGLTLACLLQEGGIRVRVVEQHRTRARQSKALGVHARTMEVLDRLGIARALVKRGTPIEFITFFVGGKRLLRLPYRDVDSAFSYMLLAPQYETEALLEARLEALGGRVERGRSVVERRRGPEHCAALIEDDQGNTELVEPRFLVGCDGARSTVRKCLGLEFDGATYDDTWLLADIELDAPVARNEAYGFTVGDTTIGVLPLPDGKFRVIGPIGDRSTRPDGITRDEFVAIVEALGALPGARFGHADWVTPFRVHRRLVSRYRLGPVFLAGDAAHVHSPAGGQGMNVGIQDAYNLGWKLAAVLRQGVDPAFLDSYEAERRPVAEDTIQGTDRMTRLVLERRPVKRLLRDLLVPLILRSTRALAVLGKMSNLAVTYRQRGWVAALSPRSFFGRLFQRRGPLPGDRFPDAPLEDGRRLHQLLRPGRHVLVGIAPNNATRETVQELRTALRRLRHRCALPLSACILGEESADGVDGVPDPRGVLRRKLGVRGLETWLIRPDGYIGLRGPGIPADLDAYTTLLSPARALPASTIHGFDPLRESARGAARATSLTEREARTPLEP